jgi:hypothetical protein
MNLPNDFHLTDDEETITIEITSRSLPITPEMRFSPRKPRHRGDSEPNRPGVPQNINPDDAPAEPQ